MISIYYRNSETFNYEVLLDAAVKISGVKVFDLTDDSFKKVYRGEQLVFFRKYQNSGDARVTLKANLTGQDKTYTSDFKFPDLDTDNPELERLWALAAIERIESMERIGQMPPSESENAVRDLGLTYQIVTDYTSMVVLSDSAIDPVTGGLALIFSAVAAVKLFMRKKK